MLGRNKKTKEAICKILQQYKDGDICVASPKDVNAEKLIASVNPQYHKCVESTYRGCERRYRFNICKGSRLNRINLTESLEKKIIEEVRNVLRENNIDAKFIVFNAYFPHYESRPYYATWIECLDIHI